MSETELSALRHQALRNHDYSPKWCSGCEQAERILTGGAATPSPVVAIRGYVCKGCGGTSFINCELECSQLGPYRFALTESSTPSQTSPAPSPKGSSR